MKKLFLVRHGKSTANADLTVYFQKDLYDHNIALTELGKKQAAEAGQVLKRKITSSYMVFVSPYLRATETMDGILPELNQPPKSIIVDGRLREQEFKVFKDKDEYEEKRKRRLARGKLYYRFKNAESGYDVLDRVGNFYNQLRMDWLLGNREETVIVVCHDIVIRSFLLLALDLHPEQFEKIWIKNCDVIELDVSETLKFSGDMTPFFTENRLE